MGLRFIMYEVRIKRKRTVIIIVIKSNRDYLFSIKNRDRMNTYSISVFYWANLDIFSFSI